MKKITTISLSILVSTLLITITTIAAAERVKVHELAESGVIITFPMTSEEISAENAEKVRLNSTREANVTKPEERLHLFEMAESGDVIEFPAHEIEPVAESTNKIIGTTAKTEVGNSKN